MEGGGGGGSWKELAVVVESLVIVGRVEGKEGALLGICYYLLLSALVQRS